MGSTLLTIVPCVDIQITNLPRIVYFENLRSHIKPNTQLLLAYANCLFQTLGLLGLATAEYLLFKHIVCLEGF